MINNEIIDIYSARTSDGICCAYRPDVKNKAQDSTISHLFEQNFIPFGLLII